MSEQHGVVMTTPQLDIRPLMRHWASGVTVVSATDPTTQTPYGMTVSTFTSLSLEPPLVSVFLKKTTPTAQAVVDSQFFSVAILKDTQADLSNRFAGFDPTYPTEESRFNDLSYQVGSTGAPIIAETLGWLECKIWAVYDGSTHHIVIGEVVNISHEDTIDGNPLIYYKRDYRQLVETDESDV
jgi:flavin reductase (DIM6/NTAB) family NADH-FMN oxidoreductase RutF